MLDKGPLLLALACSGHHPATGSRCTFLCCQVKETEADILGSLGILEAPALVVLTPEGETVKYEGQVTPFTFCTAYTAMQGSLPGTHDALMLLQSQHSAESHSLHMCGWTMSMSSEQSLPACCEESPQREMCMTSRTPIVQEP